MGSTVLMYGPGARQAALAEAHKQGRLLAPPFGDEGLKMDQAREIVSLLKSTPVGSAVGVVVVGPLDQTSRQAAQVEKVNDAFLKIIEEPAEWTKAVLWAHDLEGVRPTIRSRCLPRWCPDFNPDEMDDELEAGGRDLVRAALTPDRYYEIPKLVKQFPGREHELLAVMAEAIHGNPTPEASFLWERLRRVAEFLNPTAIELVAALLPEV